MTKSKKRPMISKPADPTTVAAATVVPVVDPEPVETPNIQIVVCDSSDLLNTETPPPKRRPPRKPKAPTPAPTPAPAPVTVVGGSTEGSVVVTTEVPVVEVSVTTEAEKKPPTKRPPAPKRPKRAKITTTGMGSGQETGPPTLQIANIILHLKCSMNDLEHYNEDMNRQLTDPLVYNPHVPPDIMTYQPADPYTVLDDGVGGGGPVPRSSSEHYAYLESVNRPTLPSTLGSDTPEGGEVPPENIEPESSVTMKEINTKLKKLKISLFKNMAFMDKKSACFWCTYDFDNPECYIPKYEMDGTIHGYGSFCRPECAAAFLMKENIDDSTRFERYHLLNQIYSKIYDYKRNIKPAPNPYYTLEKYYGNLTIQEYRKLLKSDHLLLVIDKPMTRILPELHEDNEEFLTNIYGTNNSITGGGGGGATKPSTYGVYKVRRQSEKPTGVSKSSIIKEHFGITG
jgi:hypothetical protein